VWEKKAGLVFTQGETRTTAKGWRCCHRKIKTRSIHKLKGKKKRPRSSSGIRTIGKDKRAPSGEIGTLNGKSREGRIKHSSWTKNRTGTTLLKKTP